MALGCGPVRESSGLNPDLFQAYIKASLDIDTMLPAWLSEGAPLGADQPVIDKGVFPPAPREIIQIDSISHKACHYGGWRNYTSAEQQPEVVRDLLSEMVQNKWALQAHTWEEVQHITAHDSPIVSKLALISKQKPDGTTKNRINWDLLRSRANECMSQGQRIILPTVN